jgi:hypothetical protein
VFIHKRLNDTGIVAGIGACGTIADLVPSPLPLLRAAAAEEEVVVELIVGCRPIAIKHCGGCAFKPDDNG